MTDRQCRVKIIVHGVVAVVAEGIYLIDLLLIDKLGQVLAPLKFFENPQCIG